MPEESIIDVLTNLDLRVESDTFWNVDRLIRRLCGDYTAGDFVESAVPEDITTSRRAAKLQKALLKILPAAGLKMVEIKQQNQVTNNVRQGHASTHAENTAGYGVQQQQAEYTAENERLRNRIKNLEHLVQELVQI
ncbi:hypothetical protein TSAR_004035, partial [Trichomalopsis sarcophagae]